MVYRLSRLGNYLKEKGSEVLSQYALRSLSSKKNIKQTNEVGIAVVLCHRDVLMFIYGLKSLFYQIKRELPVYIVNDGTLTNEDKKKLHYFFSVEILEPQVANSIMKKKLKNYPNISAHRFMPNIGSFKLKLDALLLCHFERVIFMDADLLFLQRPQEVIEWINQPKNQSFYTAHKEEFYESDFFPEYSLRKLLYKQLGLKMTAAFSSGFFLISDKNIVNLGKLELLFKVYSEISALHCPGLEESAFSVLSKLQGFKCLPTDTYMIMSLDTEYSHAVSMINQVKMLHFGWETKKKFFLHSLKLAYQTKWFR